MKFKTLPFQITLLTLLTALFVVPSLCLRGTNIVTHTYEFGSRQFWLGLSPYVDPKGAGDWFKYSPFFAWAYTPFAAMKSSLQASAWGVFNMFFFWLGVSLWFPWKNLESRWLWLGFVLCSMEADGSFRYQQMNAALVGATLIGVFLYKQNRFFLSGTVLAIAANIKILPGLFLAGLLFPPKKKYFFGVLFGIFLCLAVPISVWGLSQTMNYHLDWYSLLLRDTQIDGILDIATTLKRLGFSQAKTWVLYPLAGFSLLLFLLQRIKLKNFNWDLWISLGLFTLLLVNPRTESPTFVLGGPAYLFLLRYILGLNPPYKTLSLFLWGAGVFLTTLCMNDIWPKALWNPGPWLQMNKTFGVFILWLSASTLLLTPSQKQSL